MTYDYYYGLVRGAKTEPERERAAERFMDLVDRNFMAGKHTQAEYEAIIAGFKIAEEAAI